MNNNPRNVERKNRERAIYPPERQANRAGNDRNKIEFTLSKSKKYPTKIPRSLTPTTLRRKRFVTGHS
jgi:hypothetical protein